MSIERPNRRLERQLQRAIMAALHELVPSFRSHLDECAACGGFHEWIEWTHQEGTNRWEARCPETGIPLSVPFELAAGPDGKVA